MVGGRNNQAEKQEMAELQCDEEGWGGAE